MLAQRYRVSVKRRVMRNQPTTKDKDKLMDDSSTRSKSSQKSKSSSKKDLNTHHSWRVRHLQ